VNGNIILRKKEFYFT